MYKNKNRLSDRIYLLAGFALFVYGLYNFGYAILNNQLVDENAIQIKGVIINEENVLPNGGHIGHQFTYSYEFVVNGAKYKGNSQDQSLKVGDSVEVKYYKGCPYFNKPAHPKE